MMNILYELLKKRDFKSVEKFFLNEIKCDNQSIEKLFNLAMIYLQFPFENEDKSIYYLDCIIREEPYNFDALIIKMYLQNFYYGEMQDLHKVVEHNWDSSYREAIVLYIMSWKDETSREELLLKSLDKYSGFVYPLKKLGRIYEGKGLNKFARDYYIMALNNVKSTRFTIFDPIEKQAFIDEYILGTRLSEINYNRLKRLSECK